jgi:dienelactone hydrolase
MIVRSDHEGILGLCEAALPHESLCNTKVPSPHPSLPARRDHPLRSRARSEGRGQGEGCGYAAIRPYRRICIRPATCILILAAAFWPSAHLVADDQVDPADTDTLRVLGDEVNGTPPAKMLYAFLLGEAQKHFDARRQAIDQLHTPDDIQRRQSDLRAKFIESLGGFPEKTALNARVVGTLSGTGFRVEKVIYESRPNHHVTALLYLPEKRDARRQGARTDAPRIPGVLVPCGHSTNGKASELYQRMCILLAQNGMAALCYDPIGQGERYQLLDDRGKPRVPGSTTEHSLAGVGALLVGWQTASYRIWDGIRSMDYLASRPEVDAGRLGCTGNSGGGTLTAYLMALDERIVAAAPSCYMTSLERLFATIGPQDAEQNITGQVAFGMDHADYITMRAPRPTLLCIGTQDYFDYRGAWTSFREAKLIYGALGHGERVDLFEYNDKHGFSKPRREAAMRWLRRWLLHADDAPEEQESPVFTDEQAQCTPSGQVLAEFRGDSVFDINATRAKALAERRKPAGNRSEADLRDVVRKRIALPNELPVATRREAGTIQRDGYRVTKIVFETEPGVIVPALAFSAHAQSQPQNQRVIYLNGAGMAADAAPGGAIEQLARSGHSVLALDLRGWGETSPEKPYGPERFFGSDDKEAFLGLHLARPLLGQRVLDVLSILQAESNQAAAERFIVGIGSAGPIALHAALFDARITKVELKGSIDSWTDVVNTPLSANQLCNAVPGALIDYDLTDLQSIVRSRRAEP